MSKIFTRLNFLIGIGVVFLFKKMGWYVSEIFRKVLIYVYDIIMINLFYHVPIPEEYTFKDYFFTNICTYGISSLIYAWFSILLPILIFNRILKFQINWLPAVFLLIIWFGIDLFFKSSIIWRGYYEYSFYLADFAKIIAILVNWLGIYIVLFYALYSVKKIKNIN